MRVGRRAGRAATVSRPRDARRLDEHDVTVAELAGEVVGGRVGVGDLGDRVGCQAGVAARPRRSARRRRRRRRGGRRPRRASSAPTRRVLGRDGRADLGHLAEHGDRSRPSPARVDEGVERGDDRRRVRVVGVVADRQAAPAGDLATPRADRRGADAPPRPRRGRPRGGPRRPARAARCRPGGGRRPPTWTSVVAPRGARGEGRARRRRRAGRPSAVTSASAHADGEDRRGVARPSRRPAGRRRSGPARPSGPSASTSSRLARSTASMEPKTSRWTPATAVTTATSGATSGARSAMSPTCRAPISATSTSSPSREASRVSGTPSSLLNEPRAAATRSAARRRRRR